MAAPLYQIPGQQAPSAGVSADARTAATDGGDARVGGGGGRGVGADARTVAGVLAQSQVGEGLDELERDLIGLAPVKSRIRDIAALLVIGKLRMNLGLEAQ